jgi:cysteinyl-tRNA synthetase
MANYWMHNGFLEVEGEKMSKSLGNFFTIRELLETDKFGGRKWEGVVLRYAMLSTHYRQPIDWTSVRLLWARNQLLDFYKTIRTHGKVDSAVQHGVLDDRVRSALYDDLNTPQVIVELNRQFSDINNNAADIRRVMAFKASLDLLGLHLDELNPQVSREDRGIIEVKIADRAAARARKDFKESDRIRDELAAMGVVLKDGKDADGKPVTTWEIAR